MFSYYDFPTVSKGGCGVDGWGKEYAGWSRNYDGVTATIWSKD